MGQRSSRNEHFSYYSQYNNVDKTALGAAHTAVTYVTVNRHSVVTGVQQVRWPRFCHTAP